MRRNSECAEPEDFLVFRYTNLKGQNILVI